MEKSLLYLMLLSFIGSLTIAAVDDLISLNDPEINKSIKKLGTDLQEFINNRIQEESTN